MDEYTVFSVNVGRCGYDSDNPKLHDLSLYIRNSVLYKITYEGERGWTHIQYIFNI
jgi:hypothetical protein